MLSNLYHKNMVNSNMQCNAGHLQELYSKCGAAPSGNMVGPTVGPTVGPIVGPIHTPDGMGGFGGFGNLPLLEMYHKDCKK